MDLKKALIYCRVSSLRQVREGSGLDSQEHRCRQYAADNALIVERVFPDDGISGGLFDRPAMKSLIHYLDEHWQENYVIIFDDLKRFARDVDVHRGLKRELKDRGVKLCCLNYTFDDSPEGEFVETVFAAQNELERKQNRRQVCQKMKARMERGYWCFYPPTGYHYVKTKEHGKLLTPVYPVANILKEGMEAFANGSLLGQVDLLNYFSQKGLHKLLCKKKVHFDFVKRVLTEPLYAGQIVYQPWMIAPRSGLHKALITQEIYNRIQQKLHRPERIIRATDSIEFPFRRIVSCAFCQKPMTGSCNRGKNPNKYYAHYTCNNKDCIATPKNILAHILEKHYVELLERIAIKPEVLCLAEEIIRRLWQQRVVRFTEGKASIAAEISSLNKQIDEYVDLMPRAKSESIRIRYEEKIEGIESQIHALKKGLNNEKTPDFEGALSLAIKVLGTPAECWKNLDQKRKILLHGLIFTKNPEYSLQTGFGTPNLSLPFYINEHDCIQFSCMVDQSQKTWNTIMDVVLDWYDVLKEIDLLPSK